MEQLNLADVTFAKLREMGYNQAILAAVESENFESLRGNEILRDKKMAELLLYACINSRDPRMYPIYAYLQEDVQTQLLTETHITNNILQNAPEVIKDTPLAADKVAILNNVSANPGIVAYMSNKLIEDKQFIVEVAQQSPEALNEIINKHSVEYISSLWRKKIPKLIAEKEQKDYLIWYYLEVQKGKWKRCSRCGQIKLAHNKFFSKNNTSKDGWYSICKECRNKKNKEKKG